MTERLTIANLTGDLVVYRDLRPCDPALPGLEDLRAALGLPANLLPRKRNAEYARVMLELLRVVQARRSDEPLQLLLVGGDTDNDRMMAAHLRAVSGLPVYAFLGVDRLDTDPVITWEGDTATANRWALLEPWLDEVAQRYGTPLEQMPWHAAALLLDIDKTLLGPRGRNDGPINDSRASAALDVATDLYGEDLATALFHAFYDTLCQKEFHPLTLDNQDYVVYITMLLAGEVFSIADIRQGMVDGSLATFAQVLTAAEPRLPSVLHELHISIHAAHAAGDPTPFKAFRHAEFAATVERMLDGRLLLCREVYELGQRLVALGSICMAASDKPDEASLPSEKQLAAGMLPLHRTSALIG
ncbi:MAG: hypothetical protein HC893_15080 [Chloroflexaceae bacterium]|nr:hypothetical protein [Chloroflexaceae bacterium]NJL34926.1 hypothetical protein [Chloroflexaceae bacterium]NJO05476.1 hypothetical protein [Chloroflexaceae bacterium]